MSEFLGTAANIRGGSPVDRTDWKSYILPLLSFKRICDVDEEHATMLAEYGEGLRGRTLFPGHGGLPPLGSDVRSTPSRMGIVVPPLEMRVASVSYCERCLLCRFEGRYTN